MSKHVLMALTSPVEGQEEEYNTWYNEVHLPEILAVQGIVSCRRFKTKIVNVPGGATWQYIAIYEVETEDLGATLRELGKATTAPIAALDQSVSAMMVAKQTFSMSE